MRNMTNWNTTLNITKYILIKKKKVYTKVPNGMKFVIEIFNMWNKMNVKKIIHKNAQPNQIRVQHLVGQCSQFSMSGTCKNIVSFYNFVSIYLI
jgi:hypothetical protein